MKKKATWSQITCWIAAGLDAAAAALLTWPRYGLLTYGATAAEELTPLHQSISGIAAALMWGWTALLLVASFRRSMRLETLILTIVPVVAGLLYNTYLDSEPRLIRADWSLWLMMVFQSLIVVLLITGIIAYWREGKAKPQTDAPDLSTVVLDPKTDAPTSAQPAPAAQPVAPVQPLAEPEATTAAPLKPEPNATPLSPEAGSLSPETTSKPTLPKTQ